VRFIGPDAPTRRPRLRPTEAARTHAVLRLLTTGDERIPPPLHRIGPGPKRSRMLTAARLGVGGAAPAAESAIYDELRRRFRDAGPGRRDAELPWTPSFLPSY
jgi:hypothetical protein